MMLTGNTLVNGRPPKMLSYVRQRSGLNFVVTPGARRILEEQIAPSMSRASLGDILDSALKKLNLKREFWDGAICISSAKLSRGEQEK